MLPSRWEHRGRYRLTRFLDIWLRARPETVACVGSTIRFPFLRSEEQREMFYHLYEPDVVCFMRSWLREGDVFLDVGANVGYLTAVASDLVGPTGQVHAFEPHKAHFARLSRLVKMNPQSHMRAEAVAISDRCGKGDLHISAHAGWHSLIANFNTDVSPQTSVEGVLLDTLDNYVHNNALDGLPIRLVKIDVEGAESRVVRGAGGLLTTGQVDAWLVEVTPPSPSMPTEPIEALLAIFDRAGYRPFTLMSDGQLSPLQTSCLKSQLNLVWRKPL